MTERMAKTWLHAMKAEGVNIEEKEYEAINKAIVSLGKQTPIVGRKNAKGELFCPFCNTKIGFDNDGNIGKYCLFCGQRVTADSSNK